MRIVILLVMEVIKTFKLELLIKKKVQQMMIENNQIIYSLRILN